MVALDVPPDADLAGVKQLLGMAPAMAGGNEEGCVGDAWLAADRESRRPRLQKASSITGIRSVFLSPRRLRRKTDQRVERRGLRWPAAVVAPN